MELTDAQLEEVKNYVEQKKTIRVWMNDNTLGRADIKPREVMSQLKAKYGDETIEPLVSALRNANIGQQFPMLASRLCQASDLTVEKCDMVLAKLQDASVTINAKKAELQALQEE